MMQCKMLSLEAVIVSFGFIGAAWTLRTSQLFKLLGRPILRFSPHPLFKCIYIKLKQCHKNYTW